MKKLLLSGLLITLAIVNTLRSMEQQNNASSHNEKEPIELNLGLQGMVSKLDEDIFMHVSVWPRENGAMTSEDIYKKHKFPLYLRALDLSALSEGDVLTISIGKQRFNLIANQIGHEEKESTRFENLKKKNFEEVFSAIKNNEPLTTIATFELEKTKNAEISSRMTLQNRLSENGRLFNKYLFKDKTHISEGVDLIVKEYMFVNRFIQKIQEKQKSLEHKCSQLMQELYPNGQNQDIFRFFFVKEVLDFKETAHNKIVLIKPGKNMLFPMIKSKGLGFDVFDKNNKYLKSFSLSDSILSSVDAFTTTQDSTVFLL